MGRSLNERETIAGREQDSPIAAPNAFAAGSLIAGKYLIEQKIAEGGVGIVVLAKNVALQQRVAIKYLKSKARADKALVDRFLREARLSARITSDHVVRVFDVGTLPEGAPFMVMEYLTGHDLGHAVEKGPLMVAEAVDYVLQACDALAEAHALNIVHRDLKPGNLFLAYRPANTPIVKIIDFGISKMAPHLEDDGTWAHATGETDRFGTPLYMSPEQLRASADLDGRSDIWSMGVVLYELLTSTMPFEGSDLPQLCTSVLTMPPRRLADARSDVPLELERIILRCLEKDPSKRFRNVAELVQELVPFGPPLAALRAARIRDIVIAGGASVRAPTPSFADLGGRAPREVARPDETTGSRVAKTIHVRRAPAYGTWRVAAILAAGGTCALLVGLSSIHQGPAASAAVPSPSAARAAGSAITPAVVAPVVASPTQAAPSEGPSGGTSHAAPAAAVAARRAKPLSSSSPHDVVAVPTASEPPAAPAPSNDRRALFGERQ